MCSDGEHFLESEDVRIGYIKPAGRPWRKVRYANVDGQAVLEGCILLGPTEAMERDRKIIEPQISDHKNLLTDPRVELQGVGITGKQYRWPNRTIPIFIPTDLPDPDRVLDAIKHWHAHTSIRFVPHSTQNDYVVVTRVSKGCASAVGRQKGPQPLYLRDSCTLGNVIHELGHTVGLWHEQSREDREAYLDVLFDNVISGREFNFDQHVADGDDLGPYDFGSIMHYPLDAFSADGQPTMRLKPGITVPPGVTVGQRDAMSAGDIAAVEDLYQGVALALS